MLENSFTLYNIHANNANIILIIINKITSFINSRKKAKTSNINIETITAATLGCIKIKIKIISITVIM